MTSKFKSQLISLSGVELEVRRGGSGPPLLFLHPGTGLRDHDAFLDKLAHSHEVIAPTTPGFDGAGNSKSFTTVGDLAYFYLDFLDELAVGSIAITGASLGAWIAAEIAVRCKFVCSRLVLVGPIGAKFGGEREREIKDLFAYPLYEQDRLLFSRPDLAGRSYANHDQQKLITMARNFETFARVGWAPTLYNPKLVQRLRRLDMPVLVLRGSEDQVVSEDYCRNFSRALANGRYEPVEDAGHYAHLEQIEKVCARIEHFLLEENSGAKPRQIVGVT